MIVSQKTKITRITSEFMSCTLKQNGHINAIANEVFPTISVKKLLASNLGVVGIMWDRRSCGWGRNISSTTTHGCGSSSLVIRHSFHQSTEINTAWWSTLLFYIFLQRTLAASTVSTFPVEIIICHKKMSLHDGKPNITHIGNIWTEKKHASLFLSLNYYFCVDIYPFQVDPLHVGINYIFFQWTGLTPLIILIFLNLRILSRWLFILLSLYFYF